MIGHKNVLEKITSFDIKRDFIIYINICAGITPTLSVPSALAGVVKTFKGLYRN